MLQVSYVIISSQRSDSVIVSADNANTLSSYTWTNLVYQGRYQFSVVAFTSAGPGEVAILIYNVQSGKHLIQLKYNCVAKLLARI